MAIELKYRLVYEGGEADRQRLPAHDGALSLEGFTWTLSLLAHYAATGKIRNRGELSPNAKVFLLPARQGSFIADAYVFITEPNNLFLTSIIGTHAVATIGGIFNSLIVSAVREVCGLSTTHTDREERLLSKFPSGDREALLDRIEPSMRRTHEVIGDGVDTIHLRKSNRAVARFSSETKAYVNAQIPGRRGTRDVSVGAYNFNSGNGRMYLADIGKTVPFAVPKGLDAKTYSALSYSLDQYVNRRPSVIEIDFSEVLALDGRIKKLRVHKARKATDLMDDLLS